MYANIVQEKLNDDEMSRVSLFVLDAIFNALDVVYLAYKDIANSHPDMSIFSSRKLVERIPSENAGAGRLACHAVAGVSVARSHFLKMVPRWRQVVTPAGPTWVSNALRPLLPHAHVVTVEQLEYGPEVPDVASLDQLYYYDLCRNV